MSRLRSMVVLIVSMACWGQQIPPKTYSSLYLDRLGKTEDTHLAGGYLFEEIYDQPRTPGQPYYPILKVTKDGKVVRIITPDNIPLGDSDCEDGTCAQIRSRNPEFEYEWGPCFGKAIFDGPAFLAYAPEGNIFYFYVITQAPALWADRSFIVYYADLDSDELFRVGKTWGSILYNGSVSPGHEDYIAYRAREDKMQGQVGLPLRVMQIYDGNEKSFPEDLHLPTDQFHFYSVHSYHWLNENRIQLEVYSYREYPGRSETSQGATIQTITYDIPIPPPPSQSKEATPLSLKISSAPAIPTTPPKDIKKPTTPKVVHRQTLIHTGKSQKSSEPRSPM